MTSLSSRGSVSILKSTVQTGGVVLLYQFKNLDLALLPGHSVHTYARNQIPTPQNHTLGFVSCPYPDMDMSLNSPVPGTDAELKDSPARKPNVC